MPKQFASFNAFVSRQTLPISSCDGLCTDQNEAAAHVDLHSHIAVACSKLSQTSQFDRRRKNAMSASEEQANASSLFTAGHTDV
jgi:hypothetical protein